jgi:dihydroorotase
LTSRPAGLLVRGGNVVGDGTTRRADVLVADGVVRAVAADLEPPAGGVVLDAGGCLVGPGLVDLHTHLRQPGGETAETIESGTRAAALGGFTAVVAMPDTDPPIDGAAVVREVLDLGRGSLAEVAVAGSITVGRAGHALAPMAEMAALGVRLFTDDGRGVQDGALLRRALEYAAPLGVILAEHCEDESLAAGGSMHEGAWSCRLGLPGQPALAEEAMLARDLGLVRLTGVPMHFLHLSSAGSVRLIQAARAEGLRVTAEVTPHHLALTDESVASYDPVFKVNPPLRTLADVVALRRGLADGTIDAVATDHAPHPQEAKEEPFELAPPGMLGLETALAVVWGVMCLGENGSLVGPSQLFDRYSAAPARIAGLGARHGGPIVEGRPANLCVFDPAQRWTVDPARSASRSRNTPFAGHHLTGKVRHTVLFGEPVVIDGAAQR